MTVSYPWKYNPWIQIVEKTKLNGRDFNYQLPPGGCLAWLTVNPSSGINGFGEKKRSKVYSNIWIPGFVNNNSHI